MEAETKEGRTRIKSKMIQFRVASAGRTRGSLQKGWVMGVPAVPKCLGIDFRWRTRRLRHKEKARREDLNQIIGSVQNTTCPYAVFWRCAGCLVAYIATYFARIRRRLVFICMGCTMQLRFSTKGRESRARQRRCINFNRHAMEASCTQ